MKRYKLYRKQFLPVTIEKAWDFLSRPENLKMITPDYMGFQIVSELQSGKMYSGRRIHYIVKPFLGIPVRWESEILDVQKPYYFKDIQIKGPYKLWEHQHRLISVDNGVVMNDEVDYALPFSILGRLAHSLFVKRQLDFIFDYRCEKLKQIFSPRGINPEYNGHQVQTTTLYK